MRIVDRLWMRSAVAFALVLFFAASCGKKNDQTGLQDTGNEIVGAPSTILAKIGPRPITLAEVEVLCSYWTSSRAPQAQGVTSRRQLQIRALDALIDQVVLSQEAERRGIAAPDSVVDGMLSRWEGQFPDPTQRDAKLAERGLTLGQIREKFRQDILVQNLVKQSVADTIQVSGADVSAYYAAHPEFFETTEVHARHILKLADRGGSPDTIEAKRREVEALLARVRGGEDFAELARTNSDDTRSAVQGGDLGFFNRGRMVPEFSAAAFALAPEQVSDVVQTDYGFHIIKVEERRNEGTRSEAEVAPAIEQYLRNQKIEQAVNGLAQTLRQKSKLKMKVKA
jgi:peptidyl-prolyl cis-trans isomerase C